MLLSRIEDLIVDDMSHRQIRYVSPVPASNPKGELARLYKQIRSDFQLVPPLTMFSPTPDLLAGIWSMWRESQFAVGIVPRFITEAVAASVSNINTCPYCVDAHTGMLHASSDNDVVKAIHHKNITLIENPQCREIVKWGFANRTPDADILTSPPFSKDEAPEIIGTALVYHYVNRMVTIFLDDTPMPVPSNWKYMRQITAKMFGATVGKSIIKRQPKSGGSLEFITTAEIPSDMKWALPNPHIAAAFGNFSHLMRKSGQEIIPEEVRNLTNQHIDAWQGEDVNMNQSWFEEIVKDLSKRDKIIARLVLLTALAPYQVCDKDIQRFRSICPGDEKLLVTTSWASFAAAKRINSWLIQT